jgi:hypothetical protein
MTEHEIEGYVDPEEWQLHYQTIEKLNKGKR